MVDEKLTEGHSKDFSINFCKCTLWICKSLWENILTNVLWFTFKSTIWFIVKSNYDSLYLLIWLRAKCSQNTKPPFKDSKDNCLNSECQPPSKRGQWHPCNKTSFTEYMLRDIRGQNKFIEGGKNQEKIVVELSVAYMYQDILPGASDLGKIHDLTLSSLLCRLFLLFLMLS